VQRLTVQVGHRYRCGLCYWTVREFSPEPLQEALPLVRPNVVLEVVAKGCKTVDQCLWYFSHLSMSFLLENAGNDDYQQDNPA
jgi:hypothetical protein